MILEVQKYLREREGYGLSALARNFAIKAKAHSRYPNLIHFKYNQIESPFAERIVQECRGIILDAADNWNVVCRTFDKFFNHGEQLAAEIDWSTARVEEKADGSLIQVYHYAGEWHAATSGTPDASGRLVSANIESTQTFAELFWETAKQYALKGSLKYLDEDACLAFELMTPFNRVVVPHKEPKLALLGLRNRRTGEWFDHRPVAEWMGVPAVRTFPLQSWDQCVEAAKHVDPSQQEGYVVVDAQWRRVKMKAPAYVALAHLRDNIATPRKAVEIIRQGESTEFLAYFPEWKPTFDDLKARFDAICAEIDADFARLKHIPVQKDFALEAERTTCPGALYQMRRGSVLNARAYLARIHIKHLLDRLRFEDRDEVLDEAA